MSAAFTIAGMLLGIIEQAKSTYDKFRERAKQKGELTPEQETALDAREEGIFAKYEKAAPPPAPESEP